MRILEDKYEIDISGIVITILAIPISFIIVVTLFHMMTGSIESIIYLGITDVSSIPDELYQQLQEKNIPGYPLIIVYLFLEYLGGKFGTNWASARPIIEEINILLPNTLELVINSYVLILVVILPLVIIKFMRNESNFHSSTKPIMFGKILAIFVSFLPLMTVTFIKIFAIDLYDLHGGFITPGWRSDADGFGRVFLPMITGGGIGLTFGLIAYASNLSERAILKFSFLPVLLSTPLLEIIYSWPGIGRYLYSGLLSGNIPTILACFYIFMMITTFLMIILNLIPLHPYKDNTLENTELISELKEIKNTKLVYNIAILIITIAVLFLIPLITPYRPDDFDWERANMAPTIVHFFGTDWEGQDVFSRVLYSLQVIAIQGVVAGFLAVLGYISMIKSSENIRIVLKGISVTLLSIAVFSYLIFSIYFRFENSTIYNFAN